MLGCRFKMVEDVMDFGEVLERTKTVPKLEAD